MRIYYSEIQKKKNMGLGPRLAFSNWIYKGPNREND